MKTMKCVVSSAGALILLSQVAAATTPNDRTEELRTASTRLAGAADATKGGPRALILQERNRVNSLLDDLQHGRPVNPADIDRALERAQRPLP